MCSYCFPFIAYAPAYAAQLVQFCLRNLTQLKALLTQTLLMTSPIVNMMWEVFSVAHIQILHLDRFQCFQFECIKLYCWANPLGKLGWWKHWNSCNIHSFYELVDLFHQLNFYPSPKALIIRAVPGIGHIFLSPCCSWNSWEGIRIHHHVESKRWRK